MTEPTDTLLQRLISQLVWARFGLLLAVGVLAVLAWPVSQRLAFDQSIESLYAEEDPHLEDYLESKSLFGGDEFVIVAYQEDQLFEGDTHNLVPETAERIRLFAEELSAVPGVLSESVQHLESALQLNAPLTDRAKGQIRGHLCEQLEGVLVGEDRRTTSVVLRIMSEQQAQAAGTPRAETIAKIREIAAGYDRSVSVVGEPVQVHDMFRYVEDDGRLLFRVSLLLLGGVIFILFRSLQWVLLPLLVVVVTIVWTEAILVLTGIRLSMVSSMLNSLVTIISIATVTHVTVFYRERRRELERVEALRQTFTALLPAIFWTCCTTAAGFGALLSSHITPVRSFGTMMSLATLLVLTVAASALPGGILIGRLSADPHDAPAENRLRWFLGGVTDSVEKRPLMLTFGALLIVTFAGLGFFRLEVETDFSKNFRANSEIVRSLSFVEDNLGGAGTWEVNFWAPHELTEEYLGQVRDLAQRLREIEQDENLELTKVVAITDGLDLIPHVPFLLNTLDKRMGMLKNLQPEFASTLYSSEGGRMRVVLRARERQPSESKMNLIAGVRETTEKWLAETVKPEYPEADGVARTTGLFVLLAFLIESLLSDQLVSFVLAAIGIGTMMTIAFRSLTIGLISLVPNLFPIVLVIGSMGWIGLPINIATAMIASVSMGLTVDSSIHYISGYRRARKRGLPVIDALRETHQGVGRALVFANVALIVGFSVLTLSHFIPLIYFGILVSVAMLGGLVGNLVLLPLLLHWVSGERRGDPQTSQSNAD